MFSSWQTIAAPLVVLLAITYLIRDVRRRKGASGCASGGACACPRPKVPTHLQSR